jgi:hypothetical protein
MADLAARKLPPLGRNKMKEQINELRKKDKTNF